MIHIIVGTKAQLIKMAPIMAELQSQDVSYNFISTGQHKETMDQLLNNFSIKKPDYVLYSGKDITGIVQMSLWTIKILWKTAWNKKEIFKGDKNGIVLVHGDTFSTLLGALMGKVAGLKVGHVESGLRSYNIFNPFPEELTRRITFRLADYYFCGGEWALRNVKKYKGRKINTQENTLLDSLRLAVKTNTKVDTPKEKYVVVSIHRFENIFKKGVFEKIIDILQQVAEQYKVLFILHPPTKQKIHDFGLGEKLKGIELRPRYNYFEFVSLISHSEFVISDGGSNQEECFYLGKPCLLLRYATERNEGLGKNVVLSKFDEGVIKSFVENYTDLNRDLKLHGSSPSEIIVSELRGEFL